MICGNYGEAGHNLRTCPENHCSYCAEEARHNLRKYPENYYSYYAEDGHKIRDCALAKENSSGCRREAMNTKSDGFTWEKIGRKLCWFRAGKSDGVEE